MLFDVGHCLGNVADLELDAPDAKHMYATYALEQCLPCVCKRQRRCRCSMLLYDLHVQSPAFEWAHANM